LALPRETSEASGSSAGGAPQRSCVRQGIFKPPPPRPAPSTSLIDHRIAEELEYITRQLEQIGGILAEDPILVRRHAGPLQSIDTMKQSLRNLANVVAAEHKSLAADRITLPGLKARLQRKALRSVSERS
jgi:hypothetical protein